MVILKGSLALAGACGDEGYCWKINTRYGSFLWLPCIAYIGLPVYMSNPCVSRLYTACGRERFWSSASQPTPSFWCFLTPSQSPASQRSINKNLPFQFVEAYTDDRCIILCSNNHSRRIKNLFSSLERPQRGENASKMVPGFMKLAGDASWSLFKRPLWPYDSLPVVFPSQPGIERFSMCFNEQGPGGQLIRIS